ncbi:MAG TPA: hypothetical protein VK206_05280 [Anaerolineales bacterium]|nr:hypothetical protein [Anaerolineales bacterium]
MTSFRLSHKIYFFAVGFLALWVGFFGFFLPTHVDWALPWMVPPLHARFLGSMYLSGTTFMILCLLASRWYEVRVVLPMIAIWTGMLFIISLFYLSEFNFAKPQPWIWFLAYLIYPLIALWLALQYQDIDVESKGPALPGWARIYFFAQGIVMTVLGLALLSAPGFMVSVWPWKITQLLAHLYSAPFLSYGIGSLLLSRRQTWSEVRIPVTATLVFAVGVLIASILHRGLFSAADVSDWLWFIGFIIASIALALFTVRAFAAARG